MSAIQICGTCLHIAENWRLRKMAVKVSRNLFGEKMQRWRALISRIVAVVIVAAIVYWMWRNQSIILQTFSDLGLVRVAAMVLLLEVALILSIWAFMLLVRGTGYAYGFSDGYHNLNLSQAASMIPGKIWGYVGLAGLLWRRGVTRSDSVVIITLNTILMLYACAMVGAWCLIPQLGWTSALASIVPAALLICCRTPIDRLWHKLRPSGSFLPASGVMFRSLSLGIISWVIVSICFVWLIYSTNSDWRVPPLMAAATMPVSYLGGFVALIAPSGLGVSEGIITLLLGPFMGHDKALASALAFRIIHTAVIMFNILLTILLLSMKDFYGEHDHVRLG